MLGRMSSGLFLLVRFMGARVNSTSKPPNASGFNMSCSCVLYLYPHTALGQQKKRVLFWISFSSFVDNADIEIILYV